MIPQGNQTPQDKLITLSHFLPERGSNFFLTWQDTYSGYKFAIPAHRSSAKTTNCELTECLIYQHGVPYTIASVQGIYFTVRAAISFCSVNSLILPYFPEAMKWSFKDSDTVQLDDHTFVGWGNVLKHLVYVLNQCPVYDAGFSPPQSSFIGWRNKEWKTE